MTQEQERVDDGKSLGAPAFLEGKLNEQIGNYIHLFLTVLAVLLMAAASIASVEMVIHGFPKLWSTGNEYQALHLVLQDILLAAIAGTLQWECHHACGQRRSG